MPAVTPPPDRMLPSLTMRASSTMAPKTGSNSRHAQWQAARRPRRKPAAPKMSDPVHTEVRWRAVAPSRAISLTKRSFSIAARQPPPPGTRSTSHDSIAARSSRFEKVRRSAVTGSPPSEPTRTFRSGVRERNWCGPVKSSWVTPSYTGTTTLIGCDIPCLLRFARRADLALPREHSDRAFRHSVQPRSRFAGASPDRQTVKDGLRESTNCVDVRRLRHVSLPLRPSQQSRQNPVELADDLAQIALHVGVRRGLDRRRTEHEATRGPS